MTSFFITRRARAGRLTLLRAAISAIILGGMAVPRLGAADALRVSIENFSFSPDHLSVKVGGTVIWRNADDIPHSVVLPGLSFHSKPLDTNESTSFAFAKPGEYAYFCGLHPHMKGTITVVP